MVHRTPSPQTSRPVLLAAGLLALAAVAVYANSFSVPFLFDDAPSTLDNPTIRHLWPLWAPLSPPHHHQGLTVEGRPLLNLSLAINYAISGTRVWSYHALNLTIHLLAGLTLFGVVRRTVPRRSALSATRSTTPIAEKRVGDNALHLAFAVALLWIVHPLQTESVTYIIQRAESLMTLFYLLTLYCFIRATDAGGETEAKGETEAEKETEARRLPPRGGSRLASVSFWSVLSFLACLCGMASKEVMVSAPLIVFLYDRTFVSGSFGGAWRARRGYYLALGATWLVLFCLVIGAGNRGGTIGPAAGVTPWQYLLCQSRAIIHYLKLSFWPSPLVFDYGSDFVSGLGQVLPYALLDVVLLAATGFALWRRPSLGFLGVVFFAVLAPTSSFVGGTRQMLAEHRMYLPLAAVIVLVVCGGQAALRRVRVHPAIALLVLATGLGIITVRRNEIYHSQISLFRDSAIKRPGNTYAHYNLGKALDESGAKQEAIEQYREAIRCDSSRSAPFDNLGKTLSDLGRLPEAAEQYQAALRLDPNDPIAHDNLGRTWLQLGRKEEARSQFYDVALLQPNNGEARDNLGGVLLELGQIPEAIQQLRIGVRIDPRRFETHYMLGNAYMLQDRPADAVREYEQALQLNPGLADARANLAIAQRRAAAQ